MFGLFFLLKFGHFFLINLLGVRKVNMACKNMYNYYQDFWCPKHTFSSLNSEEVVCRETPGFAFGKKNDSECFRNLDFLLNSLLFYFFDTEEVPLPININVSFFRFFSFLFFLLQNFLSMIWALFNLFVEYSFPFVE